MTEATPQIPLNPDEAFQQLLDVTAQREEYTRKLNTVHESRVRIAPALRKNIGKASLLEIADSTDRLKAGIVIGHQPESVAEINTKLEQLQALNSRIEAGSGDITLWIASHYEDDGFITEYHHQMMYRPVSEMGIGRLTADASIQVTRDGEFLVPLVSGITIPVQGYGNYVTSGEFGAIDPSAPLELYQVNTEESRPTNSMRIETADKDLGKFVLLIGDPEIQEALNVADNHARKNIEASLEEFTAKLF